ncbi:MAG: hypothetical protein ACI9FU_002363, partial [Granulosicoccus sp.]
MKTNRIIFLVLLLLAAAAVYVYTNDNRTTLKQDLSDFAMPDTAFITKVFLADRQGKEILLERLKSGKWQLNGEYDVRRDLLDVLLRTIEGVEMKAPISKSAHNNIVRNMAGKSTKVEIYTNHELSKTYYVGNSAQDNLGTYMLIEGSSVPYITHLPGFNGYLTPRYSTFINEWRSTLLCNYRVSQIKSLEINYHQQPENSFRIDRLDSDKYKLTAMSPETEISEFDSVAIRRYLLGYRKLHFETFEERKTIDIDSVLAAPKLLTMTVQTFDGGTLNIDAWRLELKEESEGVDGTPM